MKKYTITIFLLVLILASYSFVFAKETIGNYVLEFDEKIETDTDSNGKNDRTSYYQGGVLVWSAFDANEDGKPDLWLRYKNGDTVDLELYDPNGDGEPDKIAEFDYQGKREVIYDASAKFANKSFSFGSIILWILIILGAGALGYRLWAKNLAKKM